MSADVEARYLPGVLREIADLIGLSATLVLVKHYGGIRLYVPKQFDPNHPLAKIVGHEASLKLVETYGGIDHFDIPKGEIAVKAARDKQIRAERGGGATHASLAVKHGLTERQIRNICGPEVDDRQVTLF